MANDYTSPEPIGKCPVLIVSDGSTAADGVRSIELAQAMLVRRVNWTNAVAAVSGTPRKVLMLEAEHVEDRVLDVTLPAIAATAADLRLPVIVALREDQINVVASHMLGELHQLLCVPSVADRVAALVIAAEQLDRVVLLDLTGENEAARLARLNAEVARIAEVLARLTRRDAAPGAVVRTDVADNRLGYDAQPPNDIAINAGDIRRIIRARRLREQFLGSGLFEDPAWDMLLDLFAAYIEETQVSVSSLCIAAAVAPTTALRWISKMSDAGLLERQADPFDRRRAFVALSARALDGMRRYVAATQRAGLPVV